MGAMVLTGMTEVTAWAWSVLQELPEVWDQLVQRAQTRLLPVRQARKEHRDHKAYPEPTPMFPVPPDHKENPDHPDQTVQSGST